MAKIIIQGEKREIQKAESALKEHFSITSTVANVKIDGEYMSIVDAYSERLETDRFSDEEIQKALDCHSSAVKKCSECPYKKEKDCSDRLLMDGTVYVHRLFVKKCNENENRPGSDVPPGQTEMKL